MKTIYFDGDIGTDTNELSAKWLREQLPHTGEPIEVVVNSAGGNLFEAFTMIDIIAAYRGKTTAIVASAFSAASLFLIAFDEVEIGPNGYCMVHAPSMDGGRGADDADNRLLAQLRQKMIALYSQKIKQPLAKIARMIDQEVFFDSEASVSLGLCDRITSNVPAVMARQRPKACVASGATAAARWKLAVSNEYLQGFTRNQAASRANKSNPGLRAAYIAEANKR
jgi:ATP-dependent protease ClpP protease subunit